MQKAKTMNHYPVSLKYHGEYITRKTTQETLSSSRDVKSMIIQAFPHVKEEQPLHLFWCKSKESGLLYPLLSQEDYLTLANWHKQNFHSFINVYDSINDIILIDKEQFKNHLENFNQLLK